MDSNEISNQVGNKKGKSNRQLRILLKLLNTIFGFGMFVATGTNTIFSSRSPHYFSFKMHRNEEERPKAVLPVLQPQAARRHTFETPQNLGTFLQILFKLFRFVVLLPNSWKGFDGSIFFRMKRCDSWDACEVKRRSQEGFLKDQLREAGQARMVGPNFLNFNMDRQK